MREESLERRRGCFKAGKSFLQKCPKNSLYILKWKSRNFCRAGILLLMKNQNFRKPASLKKGNYFCTFCLSLIFLGVLLLRRFKVRTLRISQGIKFTFAISLYCLLPFPQPTYILPFHYTLHRNKNPPSHFSESEAKLFSRQLGIKEEKPFRFYFRVSSFA